MKSFELLVIGGGVNGTGIARDAAMRGLSTMLVEKKDFAAGSSGANSGMIHGGARYLLFDAKVTKLSCLDSGYIQKIAPHLLFRIPFLIPVMPSGRGETFDRAYLYGVECYMEEYDRYQPLKNGKPHTRLSDAELHELEPGIAPGTMGAVTMDEYGIDPFRLCTLNARSAAEHGAEVRNHAQVTSIRHDGASWLVDLDGTEQVRAKTIFNAGGPWAPKIAALAGYEVKIRPGKGVHVTLDRRLSNYGVICKAIDGRDVFVMPHEDSSIIGTTDDDFYGDPDELTVSQDEVEYLMQAAERAFPLVRQARILRAWAGVRPTLWRYGPLEDALSRDHEITHHGNGFYSIVGGKLASFRAMAEEAVDAVSLALGKGAACETHRKALPGGANAAPAAEALSNTYGVPVFSAARVAYRHGAEAAEVLALTNERPELAAVCCPCEGVTFAELEFSRTREFATSLLDLRRRCRLAMGICQGSRCIGPATALVESLDEARALLDERWKGQRPVLAGDGLAQAELLQATYFGTGALQHETETPPWR
ncbi:MAG: glycerol-3-phosphate dehydrogenase/oxidase [Myxococcales bacterium]|nr:glycerol-3-phosphate dehydrogenase/oxidase [Myxococcales bacterium]